MFKKVKSLFTVTKWKTVWTKRVKGWSAPLIGDVQRNVPMIVKLQLSNKNSFRFILSDGDTYDCVDTDYVTSYISGAREAMRFNGCA